MRRLSSSAVERLRPPNLAAEPELRQGFARLRTIAEGSHFDRSTRAAPLSERPPTAVDFYELTVTQWERDLRDLRRRLLGALGFIVLLTLIGTAGFSIIDPSAGLVRAFFMTAITLTTVGYGEENPA